MSIKLAVLGCGLRTPLLLHGLAKATDLAVSEITLFDKEPVRAQMMAALAGPLLQGTNSKAIVCPTLESAIAHAPAVTLPTAESAWRRPSALGRAWSGNESATSATARPKTPPTPRPVIARKIMNCVMSCAKAESPVQSE